ncbi:MAG TPA: peptide MFS transporter [Steroidobacteraceae bacterium]|nr:peptide MFS transporter [Steroidobacteraceae bacterium]
MSTEVAGVLPQQKDWFGQPRGLTILFLTEMWEIFSYIGMRVLLVYYMTKQLAIGQQDASLIYGAYNAFLYFTPIVGGIVCDRWLGRRNSVVLGGSIMALGHFMMAFEPLFFVALATIAIGNGLFLPALPSQIPGLYSHDDPRRKTAYNYYYLGINVGGFLAPLGCGTVGELYGWHWGFTLAGIGMVSGLVIYIIGGRYLPPEPPRVPPAPSIARQHWYGGGTARRFALLAGIVGMVVIFRTAYEQVGNTLPLWIEHADRSVGAFVIPMTWFQSLNPLLVLLLTPWFVARWIRHAREGHELSSIRKMSVGAGVVALSYLILAAVAAASDGNVVANGWIWLIVFFVVMTAGELYILPIGIGLFARLAPAGFAATAIALWFLANFFGNLLAGAFGRLWSSLSPPQFFAATAAIAALSGALLLAFNRPTQRAEAE